MSDFNTPPFIYELNLPPKPMLIVGRENEQKAIIATLLDKEPARIIILGEGGIGKTTLALSVLNDPQIGDRYSARYFVSCEATTTVTSLLPELANVLRIPPSNRDEKLSETVLSLLRQKPCLLCLDNFETLWEDPKGRAAVDTFLKHIASEPTLGILMTMRGTQRPSSVSWSRPLLPSLAPLEFRCAVQVFEHIAGPPNESAEKMLRQVDGIPLAIDLLAHVLQEGNETPEALLSRWEHEGPRILETGGNDRLSNLDKSIQLSIHSPRMQANPDAIHVLNMLSLLPDGLSNSLTLLDDLQQHIPPEYSFPHSLMTLKRVSLIYEDQSVRPCRLRLRSPIRQFCQTNLVVPQDLSAGLTGFFIQLINSGTGDSSYPTVVPELLNLRAVFIRAYNAKHIDAGLIKASIEYTWWSHYVGKHEDDVILLAIQNISVSPSAHSACLRSVSRVYLYLQELGRAEETLMRALKLDYDVGDVLGEANDLQILGNLYMRQDKLENAERSLNRAVELHKQALDVLGEANDLKNLGDLYIRQDKLEDAARSLNRAVELHKQAQSVLSQADDL